MPSREVGEAADPPRNDAPSGALLAQATPGSRHGTAVCLRTSTVGFVESHHLEARERPDIDPFAKGDQRRPGPRDRPAGGHVGRRRVRRHDWPARSVRRGSRHHRWSADLRPDLPVRRRGSEHRMGQAATTADVRRRDRPSDPRLPRVHRRRSLLAAMATGVPLSDAPGILGGTHIGFAFLIAFLFSAIRQLNRMLGPSA